jgi:Tfp pilus assembly protein PilF
VGRFADAERLYSILLEESPKNPQLLYLAGAVAVKLSKFDTAQDRLRQASVIAPDDPNIWLMRGQIEEVFTNWHTAQKYYERVLALKPNEVIALQRRAYVLEMNGDVESASLGYRKALEAEFKDVGVEAYSPWRNIYHCCTQKTASQWLRGIFSDPDFYRYTGLLMQPYVQLGLNTANLQTEWPAGTAVTHLYVNHDTFSSMPKSGDYKAFFMLRDPRDCVVSWYYSARYSHNSVQPITMLRENLEARSETEGYVFMIDWLNEVGFFAAQSSWYKASEDQANVRLFRYEELNQTPLDFIDQLFNFLEIPMPESIREELCERRSWSKITGGRQKGEQDIRSHYRRAKIGDWKDAFSITTHSHFNQVTGNLVSELGYED